MKYHFPTCTNDVILRVILLSPLLSLTFTRVTIVFFFCFQHEISVSRPWGVFLLPLHNSFPPTFLPKDLISPAGPSLTPSSSPRNPPPLPRAPTLSPSPTYLDALRACGRWRVARRSDRGGPAATIVSARRPGVQA